MTTKIQLLNESYEQLRRLHATYMRLESTLFDADENYEYFAKLLRVQGRAVCRNIRRSDAWEAQFQMEWSAIIRERDLLLNSANAVDPVTSDCLGSDGICEESDVTTKVSVSLTDLFRICENNPIPGTVTIDGTVTNSGACAAPHAITPECTTTPEPESGYTSGQGGT